ncbi:MAG: DUF4375 domain-containing protein [Oscillospiraceae bacterium]|nr:DUF4375 domain-containing protein [Oscillospiraceae bacterium]
MGLFDAFMKKKTELSDQQKRWNKMWDLWASGQVDSPYAELMTYQSEINNGGHDQYFVNVENISDLQKEVSVLATILPETLQHNLQVAYQAYLESSEKDLDQSADEIFEKCDNVFFENEEQIDCLLKAYAERIVL